MYSRSIQALLASCDLRTVWKAKGAEGFGNFWVSTAAATAALPPNGVGGGSVEVPKVHPPNVQWDQLSNMNLSHCSLTALPAAIGEIKSLRILRLSHNKLATLPAELQALTALEVLAADHNLLVAIPGGWGVQGRPGMTAIAQLERVLLTPRSLAFHPLRAAELKRCSSLRELNLEGNKLTTPVLDLRSLAHLQSLQLFGNPLEYLPELSPATQLRSLSLANVRIMADASFTRWEVEVGALPYMSRGHKLSPLFKLTFRRTSLQHPLLAGALGKDQEHHHQDLHRYIPPPHCTSSTPLTGRIAEDRANCELISKEEAAVQQLVLMVLSENPVVVRQACKTIGEAGCPQAGNHCHHQYPQCCLFFLTV